MVDLIIPPPLADELREIAERENQTVEELLKLLISQYDFLAAEDEGDAGWEEASAVLRERYRRLQAELATGNHAEMIKKLRGRSLFDDDINEEPE